MTASKEYLELMTAYDAVIETVEEKIHYMSEDIDQKNEWLTNEMQNEEEGRRDWLIESYKEDIEKMSTRICHFRQIQSELLKLMKGGKIK